MVDISDEAATVINDLLLDLCTELELHYEDEDFFALYPSFNKIKAGVDLLERDGRDVHPDVKKVIARFHRSRN